MTLLFRTAPLTRVPLLMATAVLVLAASALPARGTPAAPPTPESAVRAVPGAEAVRWLALSGGKLVYGRDAQGNRVPDYSHAGYGGGGVPCPPSPPG
ncbi:hypothetical protein [Streptomyces yaizuensis]|uniref:Uncharacterized protein n=1 Tax=Streptomyces yaizuensis TaxID=2989713 RepID=A0ABQ5P2I5_9ACTN|nr:hypothetical protein [Streptomyces sp. YSPA8]GLF96813.1 hypothetical protein SYYSPA8_20970 [Streptomyces sp. YSPA8]